MGNAKGDAIGVDMSGNIVWSNNSGNYICHTGISPYMSYSSGGIVFSRVQFDGTFSDYNYADEFIVSDELKIEHMDIETGNIEFKRNPHYICVDIIDTYLIPHSANIVYMNTSNVLKADFS